MWSLEATREMRETRNSNAVCALTQTAAGISVVDMLVKAGVGRLGTSECSKDCRFRTEFQVLNFDIGANFQVQRSVSTRLQSKEGL
jgi:hypothetical protein